MGIEAIAFSLMRTPLSLRYSTIALVILGGIVAIIASGFTSDDYLHYVAQLSTEQPYPLVSVLKVCAFIAIESMLLIAVLRPVSYHNSWLRSLVAFLFSVSLLLFWGSWLMHAPPVFVAHVYWLLVINILLLLLFLISLYSHLRRRSA